MYESICASCKMIFCSSLNTQVSKGKKLQLTTPTKKKAKKKLNRYKLCRLIIRMSYIFMLIYFSLPFRIILHLGQIKKKPLLKLFLL